NGEGSTEFYGEDNRVEGVGGKGVGTGNEKVYKVGEYVWEDRKKNGMEEEDEDGMEGVEVWLTGGNGRVETSRSNCEGKYEFN
ncbi:MSCRAMM family adhesin SdrC, partial [Staphylococcus capitis]|uniref:MSCRAMM family adhesin SdrC n=1 Tax=Staphylococcus capitis TaxID=29388 RepID=UPI001C92F973